MSPDLYLIAGKEEQSLGISLVSLARKGGFSTAYSLKASAFGKQFKDAGKSGARYALILGSEEVEQRHVKIKDLRNATEITIPQNSLLAKLEEFDAEGGIHSA